eukprot:1146695-Pelagomonas_calceolata.AAC.3
MVLFINGRAVDCGPMRRALEATYAQLLPKVLCGLWAYAESLGSEVPAAAAQGAIKKLLKLASFNIVLPRQKQLALPASKLAHELRAHPVKSAQKLVTTRRENNNTPHSQVLEPGAPSNPPDPL